MQIVESFLTQNPCYKANVERADARYRKFQDEGPKGLMLHSVGCAQPSAEVFVRRWNRPDYDRACVHAFIDANTGDVWQTLPWSFRGWHGGGSCNNTHIGVEMCESKHIKYMGDGKFSVIDKAKAQADARRAYNSAVELFAYLCEAYAIDPETGIISHREGGKQGIASGHVDPEHYWHGLDLPYTMDGFRAAVKAALNEETDTGSDIYRVQVGAFRNRAYAENYLSTVQKVFPGAYLKKEKSND